MPCHHIFRLAVALLVFSGLGDSTNKSEEVLHYNSTQNHTAVNGSENKAQFLLFQRPCAPQLKDFCLNGDCFFSPDAETHICRCKTMFFGPRCEHAAMLHRSWFPVEEVIALVSGLVLLLSALIFLLYFCWKRRCQKPSLSQQLSSSEIIFL